LYADYDKGDHEFMSIKIQLHIVKNKKKKNKKIVKKYLFKNFMLIKKKVIKRKNQKKINFIY